MKASSATKFAIGVTAFAALVFAASFIPWGAGNAFSPFVWRGHLFQLVGTYPTTHLERAQSGGPGKIVVLWPKTMTGWNGYVMFGSLKFPNWLVVVAAGCVLGLSWLKAWSARDVPLIFPLGLAVYGLLHAGLVHTFAAGASTIVPGGLLTAAAFLGVIVLLVMQSRWASRDA